MNLKPLKLRHILWPQNLRHLLLYNWFHVMFHCQIRGVCWTELQGVSPQFLYRDDSVLVIAMTLQPLYITTAGDLHFQSY